MPIKMVFAVNNAWHHNAIPQKRKEAKNRKNIFYLLMLASIFPMLYKSNYKLVYPIIRLPLIHQKILNIFLPLYAFGEWYCDAMHYLRQKPFLSAFACSLLILCIYLPYSAIIINLYINEKVFLCVFVGAAFVGCGR